jgi:hypothetical protein
MMGQGKRTRAAGGGFKTATVLAAAVILGAQLLALAHYHQTNPISRITAQAGAAADNGLCGLCIVAFHLPLNPAASIAVQRPHLDGQKAATLTLRAFARRAHVLASTRAPPFSAV